MTLLFLAPGLLAIVFTIGFEVGGWANSCRPGDCACRCKEAK